MKQTARLMFPKLVLLILLSSLSLACEEGCIRCTSNAKGEFSCDQCDLYSFFYKNKEGKCVQRRIENCLVPSADQNQYLCAQCNQGMILDSAALKCIAVPENQKIANCRQYSLVGTCTQCFQHYYLDKGKCSRAKVIIENCRVYFNDDLCFQCDDDYQFDVKAGECKKFVPKEHCGTHSFGKCAQCNNGYFLNPNPNLYPEITIDSTQEFARDRWEAPNYTEFPISQCLPMTVPFCKTMATSIRSGKSVQTCGACQADYYMNSNFQCTDNPFWEIKNCIKYSNLNTCSKCADDFYLDRNECKSRTSIENCESAEVNYNKCYKCVENFYNDNGVCKDRTNKTIENCKTLSRIADECDTCNTNFKLTEDWIACFPEIKSCTKYDYGTMKSSGKFTCETCASNHFLINDFTFCKKQEVPHCDSYVTNTNVCQGCNLGYYLTTGTVKCEPITLTTCKTQTKDKNECSACNNMFYLDPSKNCVPVTDPNCLNNVSNMINCSRCKGNFYLKMNSAGTAIVCLESTTAQKVDFCEYSESTDQNKICSKCPYSQNPTDLTFIVKKIPDFCQTMNSTDKCTLCKENTDVTYLSSSSSYTCVPTIKPASICSQISPTKSAVLGDNSGICIKCRNPLTHFLNGASCWERSPKIINHCKDRGATKDECAVCDEGYHPKAITTTTALKCAAQPVDFAPLSNCLVHNSIDQKKCVTCNRGYILNSKFECVMTGMFIDQVYSSFSASDGSFTSNTSKADTMSGKCALFDSSNTCRKCANGYITVAKEYNASNDNVNFSLPYSYPEIQDCVKHTDLVKKKINNDFVGYVGEGECAEAVLKVAGAKNNFTCVRCANGANVNFVKAQYSPDNAVDITSHNVPTVENCNSAGKDILSRKYSNLFFRRGLTKVNPTLFNSWIFYDTCPNSSENLIAIIDSTSSDKTNRSIPGDGTTAEPAYKCHNFLASGVANCWLYSADASTQTNFDYSTTAKCIACKPGFFATIKAATNDMFIETCTTIPDCDVSNIKKNTYMNACETCATDKFHPWKTDGQGGQHYIDISTCSARTKTNCANESSTPACHHCELGFKLDAGKVNCEAATTVPDCKTFSYLKESINFPSANNFAPLFNLVTSLFSKKYNNTAFVGSCETCNANFARFNISSKNENLECKTIIGEAAVNLVSNCKLYKGNVSKRCEQCEPGYLLSDTGESCVDNRLNQYPNCLKTKQGAAECAQCISTAHFNSSTKICTVLDNCKVVAFSSNKYFCSTCNDQYMIDHRNNSLCVPTSIPNCKYTNNFQCVTCMDGFIRVRYTSTDNPYTCVKSPYSDAYFANFTKRFGTSGAFLGAEAQIGSYYQSTQLSVAKYHRQICYKQNMPFCNAYESNFVDCKTCNDLHYKHDKTKTCTPNSIPNCKVQADQYQCTTCQDSYFLNSLKQCSKHQVQHCKEFSPTEDKCTKCLDGFYRNTTHSTCHQRIVVSCKEFEPEEDVCKVCKTDYYLHDKKCIAFSVSGCLTFKTSSDECQTCPVRYWKNPASQCIYNSQTNCKEYANDANRCNICMVGTDKKTYLGHYLKDSNGVCQKYKEIAGCAEYNLDGSNKGDCSKCQDNNLLLNKKCVPFPAGKRNCETFLTPSDCGMCICGHYKDSSSECIRVEDPIVNCHRYSEINKCSECNSGYLLNEEKTTCSLITENSCLTLESTDSCATCNKGLALYQGTTYKADNVTKVKKCMNKIIKCLAYNEVTFDPATPTVYTCSQCIPGYLPNTDQKSCVPTGFIPGCLKMESVTDCNTCMPNHVLSVDKKSCSTDIRLVGANCAIATMSKDISCKVCEPNYLMNAEGKCEKCGSEGCAICNKDDTTKCSLCSGGNFMSNSGTCSKNANNPFSVTKESVEGGDPVNVVNQS